MGLFKTDQFPYESTPVLTPNVQIAQESINLKQEEYVLIVHLDFSFKMKDA